MSAHILTEARNSLFQKGVIQTTNLSGLPWYYLANVDKESLDQRLNELDAIHRKTAKKEFSNLLGQALEIATFRALKQQLIWFSLATSQIWTLTTTIRCTAKRNHHLR